MTRKAYPAYVYTVIRVQRQATLDRQNLVLDITFRFYFCDFSGVAILFWLRLFFVPKLCNINEIGTGFIEFGRHSVENERREVSK